MWPALGTVDGNCQHQTPEGPGPDPGQLRPPFPLLKDPPAPHPLPGQHCWMEKSGSPVTCS